MQRSDRVQLCQTEVSLWIRDRPQSEQEYTKRLHTVWLGKLTPYVSFNDLNINLNFLNKIKIHKLNQKEKALLEQRRARLLDFLVVYAIDQGNTMQDVVEKMKGMYDNYPVLGAIRFVGEREKDAELSRDEKIEKQVAIWFYRTLETYLASNPAKVVSSLKNNPKLLKLAYSREGYEFLDEASAHRGATLFTLMQNHPHLCHVVLDTMESHRAEFSDTMMRGILKITPDNGDVHQEKPLDDLLDDLFIGDDASDRKRLQKNQEILFDRIMKYDGRVLTEEEKIQIVLRAVLENRLVLLQHLRDQWGFNMKDIGEKVLTHHIKNPQISFPHQAVVFLLDQGIDPNLKVEKGHYLFQYLVDQDHILLALPDHAYSDERASQLSHDLDDNRVKNAIALIERGVDLKLIQQHYAMTVFNKMLRRLLKDGARLTFVKAIRDAYQPADVLDMIQHNTLKENLIKLLRKLDKSDWIGRVQSYYFPSDVMQTFLQALTLKLQAKSKKPGTPPSEIADMAFLHACVTDKALRFDADSEKQDAEIKHYEAVARKHGNYQRDKEFIKDALRQLRLPQDPIKLAQLLDNFCCRYQLAIKGVKNEDLLSREEALFIVSLMKQIKEEDQGNMMKKSAPDLWLYALPLWAAKMEGVCQNYEKSKENGKKPQERTAEIRQVYALLEVTPFQAKKINNVSYETSLHLAMARCDACEKLAPALEKEVFKKARRVLESVRYQFLKGLEHACEDFKLIANLDGDKRKQRKEEVVNKICAIMKTTFTSEEFISLEKKLVRAAIIGCRKHLADIKSVALSDEMRARMVRILKESHEILVRKLFKNAIGLYNKGHQEKAIKLIQFGLNGSNLDEAMAHCKEALKSDFSRPNKDVYKKLMHILLEEVYMKDFRAMSANNNRDKIYNKVADISKEENFVFLSKEQKDLVNNMRILCALQPIQEKSVSTQKCSTHAFFKGKPQEASIYSGYVQPTAKLGRKPKIH